MAKPGGPISIVRGIVNGGKPKAVQAIKSAFDEYGYGWPGPDSVPEPVKIPEAKRTTWFQKNIGALPYNAPSNAERVQATDEYSNLISSLTDKGTHMPAIDIDFPCRLEPSSTPGHFHLYLEKEMSEAMYLELLRDLYKAGIIEKDYFDCSVRDKQSYLRLTHDKNGSDLTQYDTETLINKAVSTISEVKQMIHSLLGTEPVSYKPYLEKEIEVLSSVEKMLKEAI